MASIVFYKLTEIKQVFCRTKAIEISDFYWGKGGSKYHLYPAGWKKTGNWEPGSHPRGRILESHGKIGTSQKDFGFSRKEFSRKNFWISRNDF